MKQPLLCWVVVNSVPYHEARLNAVAERARLRLCMIQITEVDVHWTLAGQNRTDGAFARHTLFSGTPWAKISGRSMARELRRLLSELKPDAVCINGWSYGGCIAALSWCLAHRVPAIMMSESTAIDHPRHGWMEALKRRIVGLCSASLVGGTPHREYITALGAPPERIFTGYDAVDNEHFRAGADDARHEGQYLRTKHGLPEHFFMACCRFVPKKNLTNLLQAYARYRRLAGAASWSLVAVGDGEQMRELLALRSRLGVEEHVHFAGPKSYDELPIYYGLARAFIHASTSEQWGLVVNEAMAAGLPVLVSERCGCSSDLVSPGVNGLLFDPDDIDSIAKAMLAISDGSCDPQTMGGKSREMVARWSPLRFAEGLQAAAETALGKPLPTAGKIDRLLLWALQGR